MIKRSGLHLSQGVKEPDIFDPVTNEKGLIKVPRDSHVLCRDSMGKSTAVYGDSVWNFKPYNTVPSVASKLHFTKSMHCAKQIKWLLFLDIYYTEYGFKGRVVYTTLRGYYYFYKALSEFCCDKEIAIFDALSDERTIVQFFYKIQGNSGHAKNIKRSLTFLSKLPIELTGFKVAKSQELLRLIELHRKSRASNSKQSEVIPTRIYETLGYNIKEYIGEFNDHIGRIEKFYLACLKDPCFGRKIEKQRTVPMKVRGGRGKYSSNFSEAASEFRLSQYFKKHQIIEISQIRKHLSVARTVAKASVILYSGMRSAEALSLYGGCLYQKMDAFWIKGITTKLSSEKLAAEWCSTDSVEPAVRAIESIANIIYLWSDREVSHNEKHLFLTTNYICFGKKGRMAPTFNPTEDLTVTRADIGLTFPKELAVSIEKEDIAELERIDPFRDWSDEEMFRPGKLWPLVAHQFRRTFVFHMAQIGIIRPTSAQRQLKHKNIQMTMHYCNGASVSSVVNNNEIAEEVTNEKLNVTSIEYLHEVLYNEETLHGGHGAWVEKNTKRHSPVIVFSDMKTVQGQVNKGMLHYSSSPIGGCGFGGDCDQKVLGNFSACTSCPNSIIIPSELSRWISTQEFLVKNLDKGTVEYRMERAQLDELKGYEKNTIHG